MKDNQKWSRRTALSITSFRALHREVCPAGLDKNDNKREKSYAKFPLNLTSQTKNELRCELRTSDIYHRNFGDKKTGGCTISRDFGS